MNSSERYISHDLPTDKTDLSELDKNLIHLLKNELDHFLNKVSATETRALCSVPTHSFYDIGAFEGAGGYLTLYIRMLQFSERIKDTEHYGEIVKTIPLLSTQKKLLELAETSVKALLPLAEAAKKEKKLRISYYMGAAGYHLNACIVSYYKGDVSGFYLHLEKLLNFKKVITSTKTGFYMEVLYGVSGYLYCLLILQECFSKETTPKEFKIDLSGDVRDLVDRIIHRGIEDFSPEGVNLESPPKDFRLIYDFHEKEYFGAAHGLFGVLYTLLSAYQLNKDFFDRKCSTLSFQLRLSCRASLEFLLSFQQPSGNFPSSIKSARKDSLVQFCHGSPGAVACLLRAAEVFATEPISETLMDSAIKAGNNIWQFGLLKKGFGLCHGISGNAYAFLALYRRTKNEKWLQWAYQFALSKTHKHIMKAIRSYEFEDRYVAGESDFPYSLMQGLAGDLCFYLDLLTPQHSRFPGYEL